MTDAPDSGARSSAEAAAPGVQTQKPTHLYDAVSTQRDHVVGSFEMQRNAILKAVADQREAALAPIKAVRERQSQQPAARDGSAQAACRPGVAPAENIRRSRSHAALSQQELVASDIVATLKALVAEEVRVQLLILLEAATLKENTRSASEPAAQGNSGG